MMWLDSAVVRCGSSLDLMRVALALGFGLIGSAFAVADTYWQHDPATSGNWFDGTNWTMGVPDANNDAYLDNNGTATVSAVGANCKTLVLGYSMGKSGVLELGADLSSTLGQYVGYLGTGAIRQTGGKNAAGGGLYVGWWASGAAGTYDLSGGEVATNLLSIGYGGGTGAFTMHSGAKVTVSNTIDVGNYYSGGPATGALNVYGGELSANGINVYNNGRLNFTNGTLAVDGGYFNYNASADLILQGSNATDQPRLRLINKTSGYCPTGLYIGGDAASAGRAGTLDIESGATLATFGVLKIWGPGTVNLNGGTLQVQNQANFQNAGGKFNWTAGTWHLTNGYFDPLLIGTGGVFDANVSLGANKTLQSDCETLIDSGATLSLDGGSLVTGSLRNKGAFHFNSGRLELTGSELAVDAGGALGANLSIASGQEWSVGLPVYVGKTGVGTVTQDGGSLSSASLYIGRDPGSSGTYTQSGGTNATPDLYLGAGGGAGVYNLGGTGSAAQLTATGESIGRDGAATFTQTGGINTVQYLVIGPHGRYDRRDGTLQIGSELDLQGVLDLGSKPLSLTSPGGILYLSRDTVLNSGLAQVALGDQALVIIPAGSNPATLFQSYSNAGLTHIAGTTLVVPAGRTVQGRGNIEDHVQVAGAVEVDSPGGINPIPGIELPGMNLNQGIELLGDNATVDLGSGQLTVHDTASAMAGGVLTAAKVCVGGNTIAAFTQQAGIARIASLSVESHGAYNLQGGTVHATTTQVSGADARFVHSRGTHSVNELIVGDPAAPGATYTLTGSGLLAVNAIELSEGGRFEWFGGAIAPLGSSSSPSFFGMGTVAIGFDFEANTLLNPSLFSYGASAVGAFEITNGARADQNGGALVYNGLRIGSATGAATYTLRYMKSPGFNRTAIDAADLYLGDGGSGTLNLNVAVPSPFAYDGSLNISHLLHIGPQAHLNAVPGTTIVMNMPTSYSNPPTGACAVENESTTPENLATLRNVTMDFVDLWYPNYPAGHVRGPNDRVFSLEAAGQDFGRSNSGFDRNFAMGRIVTVENAYLRLVDLFDNQPGQSGHDALYVDSLVLGFGTFLDLNGLTLYYHSFTENGGTILLNGGSIVRVPMALDGDANEDGKVDVSDLNRLLTGYDQTGRWSQGDFNGDGMVDVADLNKVLTNYDKTAGLKAVPEPSSLVLLGLGVAGLLAGFARRRARIAC